MTVRELIKLLADQPMESRVEIINFATSYRDYGIGYEYDYVSNLRQVSEHVIRLEA